MEISGLDYEPAADDFIGKVVYDEMATNGTFETSEELINRIHKNAYWGIRGNYRGMPTDCPQRDERLGWTGDAQVFCATACFHMDTAAFLPQISEGQCAMSRKSMEALFLT